jgi:class 3 adenylate cyclase/NAD(P)-dependent dehydrogenase (short-subunit alcohol dehydrogenase family)
MELLGKLGLKHGTFNGRVAVVTGAARGIGEQVALALAHLGAHVIILDVRTTGEAVADQINGKCGSAEFIEVDLTDLERLDAVQNEIFADHGRVDILVNNASKLYGVPILETPMALWDELHQTTVRASAFLISKFLPVMIDNRFGVIANTVAAEGLSYGAYFSSAMAGQRSMVVSLAGEVESGSGVSVFGFAPGVVDTRLVSEDTATYFYYGMTKEEWIRDFVDNPGYDGLMPAEHCGASYVYCLAHASEYHGQIADAFHPLVNHGIITPSDPGDEQRTGMTDNVDTAVLQVNDYVQGVSSVNRNLELRIEERTRELEETNRQLANQKKYIEEISSKISRYLPQQVYQSIFSGEIGAEIESKRKPLTVFFSDIRDFTPRTERLEPEVLSEVLNSYFSSMTEIARAHGATIDKFIGDAILAFFGDPQSDGPEKDAERCVLMAIDMQRRMCELKSTFGKLGLHDPLEIRIGINSGYCTVGNFGSYERMDYTIIGSPVNVAARLQSACAPNAILVSSNTQALVAETFQLVSRGELSLKGISEEVEAFEVQFDIDATSTAGSSVDAQLAALQEQLAQIDLEQLGKEEKQQLLTTMSKLLKG